MILQSVYGIATPLYGDAGIDEAVVAVILSVSSIILSVSVQFSRSNVNLSSG